MYVLYNDKGQEETRCLDSTILKHKWRYLSQPIHTLILSSHVLKTATLASCTLHVSKTYGYGPHSLRLQDAG